MDDLTAISTIVATSGIIIGVIFTILELRHFRKTRETEIIMRIYDKFSSQEMVEAINKVGSARFENITDYHNKYGFNDIAVVAVLFEGLGVLLEKNLISIDLVNSLFGPSINTLWNPMKPVIYAMREGLKEPFFFSHFERMVNKLNAYQQQTRSTKKTYQ